MKGWKFESHRHALSARGISNKKSGYYSLMDTMKDGVANGINGEKGLLRHPGEAEERAYKLRLKDELRQKYLNQIREQVKEGNMHQDKEAEYIKEVFGPEIRYLDEGRDISTVRRDLDSKTESFIQHNQTTFKFFAKKLMMNHWTKTYEVLEVPQEVYDKSPQYETAGNSADAIKIRDNDHLEYMKNELNQKGFKEIKE
jgi:hypothetical protein